MGKESIVDQAKREIKDKHKEENQMKNKAKIETIKTVVITVLLTGIAAFTLGMKYQESQDNRVKTEAASIVKSVKVEASKQ